MEGLYLIAKDRPGDASTTDRPSNLRLSLGGDVAFLDHDALLKEEEKMNYEIAWEKLKEFLNFIIKVADLAEETDLIQGTSESKEILKIVIKTMNELEEEMTSEEDGQKQ